MTTYVYMYNQTQEIRKELPVNEIYDKHTIPQPVHTFSQPAHAEPTFPQPDFVACSGPPLDVHCFADFRSLSERVEERLVVDLEKTTAEIAARLVRL